MASGSGEPSTAALGPALPPPPGRRRPAAGVIGRSLGPGSLADRPGGNQAGVRRSPAAPRRGRRCTSGSAPGAARRQARRARPCRRGRRSGRPLGAQAGPGARSSRGTSRPSAAARRPRRRRGGGARRRRCAGRAGPRPCACRACAGSRRRALASHQRAAVEAGAAQAHRCSFLRLRRRSLRWQSEQRSPGPTSGRRQDRQPWVCPGCRSPDQYRLPTATAVASWQRG
jgi:hypothetical protein